MSSKVYFAINIFWIPFRNYICACAKLILNDIL